MKTRKLGYPVSYGDYLSPDAAKQNIKIAKKRVDTTIDVVASILNIAIIYWILSVYVEQRFHGATIKQLVSRWIHQYII